MPFIIYACPNYTVNAVKFIEVLSDLPGVTFGLIAQEPLILLSPELRSRISGFRMIPDVFDAGMLTVAAAALREEFGPVHRLIAAGTPASAAGLRPRTGRRSGNERGNSPKLSRQGPDETVVSEAGLPCARAQTVNSMAAAEAFAEICGFPLVVKPPDGAGSLSTFKVDNAAELKAALAAMPGNQALLEEFITGTEHSFDTFSLNGRAVYHSLSNYYPNPLEAMREPGQWQVVLPREVDEPQYDDIRDAAFKALDTLGMHTGISHLEWFRRTDGSIAISEVVARPPGAQILTLIGRAGDFNAIDAWARLVVFGEFEAPRRQYAVGAAYLRGQGQGRVRAVHGLDIVQAAFGHLVTDFKIPQIGQEAAANYEGEGYIILRHTETEVVRQALSRVVSVVRVELRWF